MEFDNKMPIYLQVIHDIKKSITTGALSGGQKLPSARDLGIYYKINPNTSNRVYRELEAMQLCYTKRGIGTYVTEDENILKNIRVEMANEIIMTFIQEMNDLGYSKNEVMNAIIENMKE